MSSIFSFLGYAIGAIVFVIVVFITFSLLGRYVFNKTRVNKWIILAAAIITFVATFFIPDFNPIGSIAIQAVLMYICVISILWFIDINKNGYPRIKKEKKIVIKSKAKPNRAKKNN